MLGVMATEHLPPVLWLLVLSRVDLLGNLETMNPRGSIRRHPLKALRSLGDTMSGRAGLGPQPDRAEDPSLATPGPQYLPASKADAATAAS